ncbi:MAG TPA: C39 family peptidase, partial [Gemmatimonadaceae bacterium]|nr:C39 family peptidase [Gemmatimonadaceae bacterium]
MSRLGCAVTSLAMVLTATGQSVNPGTLNNFMNGHDGYTVGGGVKWETGTSTVSNGELRWKSVGGRSDRGVLAQQVCDGHATVVWVPSLVTPGGSHFVVVTGAPRNATDTTPLSEFHIVDPDAFRHTTLADYDSFDLRGFPVPTVAESTPTGAAASSSIAGLFQTAASQQAHGLDIRGTAGAILVTDPQGRRLGQAQPGGPTLNEIAGSIYYPHDEPDDAAGGLALPQLSVALVKNPSPGVYQVMLTATSTTDSIAGLDITLERADYSVVSATFGQSVTEGHAYRFDITYDTNSTTAPLIQPAVPAWASNTAYA